VVDPALGRLVERMRARDMLANRWVVVTADHGHTAVIADAAHAIDTGEDDAPGVLHALGWKTRPFRASVDAHDPFDAVLAYGGAMAFVYLADRSRCTGERACAWDAPPRYREDVLAVADAYYRNNETGELAAGMRGALDMILVRKPRPVADIDLPFEVYIGDGKTLPIDTYLAQHPHPTYVDVARRFEELAVGRHGERAGDLLLLAHNGDRERPEDRYYFAKPYRSWHGSPSRQDSEVPLIVAHPKRTAAAIHAWVGAVLGDRPYQRKVTDIVMGLRTHPPN
jgi:arylsulfatase A-like enzyme